MNRATKDNPHGVPMPPKPAQERFEIEQGYEPGEVSKHSLAGLTVSLAGPEERPEVAVLEYDLPFEEAFWTAVWWARAYGIPGVWKERFVIERRNYRLGALYRYAGFDLTEREGNYREYGETPYDAAEETLGHGGGE